MTTRTDIQADEYRWESALDRRLEDFRQAILLTIAANDSLKWMHDNDSFYFSPEKIVKQEQEVEEAASVENRIRNEIIAEYEFTTFPKETTINDN